MISFAGKYNDLWMCAGFIIISVRVERLSLGIHFKPAMTKESKQILDFFTFLLYDVLLDSPKLSV